MSTSDERPFDQESSAGAKGRRAEDDSGVERHAPSSATELWDHNAYGREDGDVGGAATTGVTDTRDPRGGAPAYNIDAGDDDAVRHGDDAGSDDSSNVRATGESLTGADATAGDAHESVGAGTGTLRGAGAASAGGAGARGAGREEAFDQEVHGRHAAADRVDGPSAGRPADDLGRTGRRSMEGGEDASVVRHEERLDVGTERVETGRARLRKYVVEEPVRAEQTLASEDVEEVRTPITEEERQAFLAGRDLPVGDDEVILYREVPVVETVRVPYERVRLVVRRTERTEVVEETVRKEDVALEEE
ncbi:hypothetical protein GCM10011374_29030 [Kocuria dechangensis]|uniref:DUF2382 domain-containing protein n=1 Tax=Kocuria dechangensis TaxID=1176249 RepID=A0A917H1E6_9MICC|nr:YsnF/AvaK domain-containing protein [Kocuria dechangensis]GGG63744.1 hypothetical protein GCM10011374_29030 [Kocuria dechangensis]